MMANLRSTVKYLERLSNAVPCNKWDAIKAGASGIFNLMLHKKIISNTFQTFCIEVLSGFLQTEYQTKTDKRSRFLVFILKFKLYNYIYANSKA